MDTSDIFTAAHRSAKFELTSTRFIGFTYRQVFRIILRRVWANRKKLAQPVQKFTVKIAYDNLVARNLLKSKRGVYNPTLKVWNVYSRVSGLGLLSNYLLK